MKKSYKLFGCAALAVALFAGCSTDQTEDTFVPEQKTVVFNFTAEDEIEGLTDEGSRTYMDETGQIQWFTYAEAGLRDYMKYLSSKGPVGQLLPFSLWKDETGRNKITFSGSVPASSLTVGEPFMAAGMIPFAALRESGAIDQSNVNFELKSEQNNATLTSFDYECDILIGLSEIEFSQEDLDAGKTSFGFQMQLARPMAISKYTFQNENPNLSDDEKVRSVALTVVAAEGKKNLTGKFRLNLEKKPALAIDADGNPISLRAPFYEGKNTVSTTFAEEAQPTLGELVFWPVTAPVELTAGDKMEFKIFTDRHEITKTVTLAEGKTMNYLPYKLNTANIKLDGSVDVLGYDDAVDLSAAGTANSYIVNKVGQTYKFRADVKGNDASQTIDPKSAVVLWYSCVQTNGNNWVNNSPVVLESVKLEDGYVEFATPETFVNGNVVIAVLDQDVAIDDLTAAGRQLTNANILWSWNLIVSQGYDIEDPERQFTHGGVTMMDRDLGAVLDTNASNLFEYTATYAQGNIYQWGRKDPFTGYTSNRSRSAAWYFKWFSAAYTPIVALQLNDVMNGGYISTEKKPFNQQIFGDSDATVSYMLDGEDDAASVEFSVKNPHIWLNRSNKCWVASEQLWGETKTIYDPCPVGWKVPGSKDWEALTAGLECVGVNNIYFKIGNIYFSPLTGRTETGVIDGNVRCDSNGGADAYFYCSDASAEGSLLGKSFRMIGPKSYSAGTEISCDFSTQATSYGRRIRCVKE